MFTEQLSIFPIHELFVVSKETAGKLKSSLPGHAALCAWLDDLERAWRIWLIESSEVLERFLTHGRHVLIGH